MGRGLERYSKDKAIEKVNKYVREGIPFVFLFNFEGDQNLVAIPAEAARAGFYMEMPGMSNHSFKIAPGAPIQFLKHPIEEESYREAFFKVIEHIHYGNSFLLNLTFPTAIETNYSLQDIFIRSVAPFKLYIENEIVVFSPERFVQIHGDTIISNPMKGTIDSGLPGAYRLLASDHKEDAEHNTIVDLIRNDLSAISSNVRVMRFKYIEKLRTHQGELLQMSSEIRGKLPHNFKSTLGERLFSLLPAGSICGAPKQKTVEIIREVEKYNRGFYTGVFGHFDGVNLDSAVAIRYIEKESTGDNLLFKSGGGVTYQSDWKKEYEEMINKVYVPIY